MPSSHVQPARRNGRVAHGDLSPNVGARKRDDG